MYESFVESGSYVFDLRENLSFLALNTLYFDQQCDVAQEESDALQAWLSSQFVETDKNFIPFFHIWPGINYMNDQRPHWKVEYTREFEASLEYFRDRIPLLIGAHTHFFNFMFMEQNGSDFDNLLISPAISPIFKNNPGITVFELSPENKAKNVRTHFLQLQKECKEMKTFNIGERIGGESYAAGALRKYE